jgi:hypothetical protein
MCAHEQLFQGSRPSCFVSRLPRVPTSVYPSVSAYQGPTLQAAEKLNSLKGTAFRPSVSDCNYVRL